MNGQWEGTYTGTTEGKLVINVDERAEHYVGAAFIFPFNPELPQLVAPFITTNKNNPLEFRTSQLIHVDPISRKPAPWDAIKERYPNVANSSHADVKCAWNNDSLKVSWLTDLGFIGEAELPRSQAELPSELQSQEMSWEEFKAHVHFDYRHYVFRGQNKPWRLRTAFHRTGRAELSTFLDHDVPVLHRHLSARTKHFFRLGDPVENGAFYHLAQHHGYPTPLLDWTYSPYVAAFFAYRGISNSQAEKSEPNDKVRILIFDYRQWTTDFRQTLDLITIQLHVSFGEFVAVENERLIPQQAISTLTNVDDVESYIRGRELKQNKTYLRAIDLPVRSRREVIYDLSFMGITASALFPGLDGACEELKERNFYS